MNSLPTTTTSLHPRFWAVAKDDGIAYVRSGEHACPFCAHDLPEEYGGVETLRPAPELVRFEESA